MRTNILGAAAAFAALTSCGLFKPTQKDPEQPPSPAAASTEKADLSPKPSTPAIRPTAEVKPPAPLPPFLEKGLGWLAKAQLPSGGFGGGSHSQQGVRDPHAVPADPGTTAFVTMAFLRAGHTPTKGTYRNVVRKSLEFMVKLVESAPEKGPQITDQTGTQPQAKMGQYVDTALAAQLFTRVLSELRDDPKMADRVETALGKCVQKIQSSQSKDGSWGGGGWAPVLQSSLMCNALEMAKSVGVAVELDTLGRAREYQKDQVDSSTGTVASGAAAGVVLYAGSGNQRAAAPEAKAAEDAVKKAQIEGKLPGDAKVSFDSLIQAGLSKEKAGAFLESWRLDEQARKRLEDDRYLTGFGNNGGEELLSYMMTSESLVIRGGPEWERWKSQMMNRLAKIQDPNGSWSGHHCITSPVFCTAAVALCLTADRDAELLGKASQVAMR